MYLCTYIRNFNRSASRLSTFLMTLPILLDLQELVSWDSKGQHLHINWRKLHNKYKQSFIN